MTHRLLIAFWLTAGVLILVLGLPTTADAQQLSSKDLKKLERQASKAVAAGQHDQAAELYQQILDGLPTGDARRGNALYTLGMRHLSPASTQWNVAHGARHLEELATSSPDHERGLELSVVRGLLSQAQTAKSQLESCSAELATERLEAEASKEEVADESKAADGRVKSLQAQLRRARSELAETKTELEKKEDALQKLKDALVGRAGVSGG